MSEGALLSESLPLSEGLPLSESPPQPLGAGEEVAPRADRLGRPDVLLAVVDEEHTAGVDGRLPDVELSFLLGMSFQLLLAEFTARVAEAGYADLRPVHGMAFQALRGPGAISSELAEKPGVTKQAAGQIVDDLEKRGYVRRTPHPEGGRRKLVVLTGAAHQHLAVAGGILHTLESELAGRTGEADLSVLRAELARLVRALSGGPLPPLRPVW